MSQETMIAIYSLLVTCACIGAFCLGMRYSEHLSAKRQAELLKRAAAKNKYDDVSTSHVEAALRRAYHQLQPVRVVGVSAAAAPTASTQSHSPSFEGCSFSNNAGLMTGVVVGSLIASTVEEIATSAPAVIDQTPEPATDWSGTTDSFSAE